MEQIESNFSLAEIRKIINHIFVMDQDFEAYCLDHFPNIKRRFSGNMERTAKLNLLLELGSPEEIIDSLQREHCQKFVEAQQVINPAVARTYDIKIYYPDREMRLIEQLKSLEADTFDKMRALAALAAHENSHQNPWLLHELSSLVSDDNEQLAEKALSLLFHIQALDMVPIMAFGLGSAYVSVRSWAASYIGFIVSGNNWRSDRDGNVFRVFQHLLLISRNAAENKLVLREVVHALGKFNTVLVINPLLEILKNGEYAVAVQMQALYELTRLRENFGPCFLNFEFQRSMQTTRHRNDVASKPRTMEEFRTLIESLPLIIEKWSPERCRDLMSQSLFSYFQEDDIIEILHKRIRPPTVSPP